MTATSESDSMPVALITGAARRVGADIARALAKKGYRVIIHFRFSDREAKHLAEEINCHQNTSAHLLQADLSNLSDIKNLAETLESQFGRCDLLINNASTFYATPLGETTESDWDTLFASNAKAPFFLAQALAPTLQKHKGSIINITDIHAQRPLKNHTIYCMAKAANIMLTQSLALELAPHIRVNGIAPGAILWPAQADGKINEAPDILDKIPMQRLGGTAAIVDSVLFLINNSSYITGQTINVDGGRTLVQ